MTRVTGSPVRALWAAPLLFLTAAVFPNPSHAAEECLSAPHHKAGEVGYWFYRIDRDTHRKCWYLGERGERHHAAARPHSRQAREEAREEDDTPRARKSADAATVFP